jgi:hypothetical protein
MRLSFPLVYPSLDLMFPRAKKFCGSRAALAFSAAHPAA